MSGIMFSCHKCLDDLVIPTDRYHVDLFLVREKAEKHGWLIPELVIDTPKGPQELTASSVESYCPNCKNG